jgi:hypothetical protein
MRKILGRNESKRFSSISISVSVSASASAAAVSA